MFSPISPEDYREAACPLCMTDPNAPPVVSVDLRRVADRLDSDLAHNDYDSAERHLRYWLSEAQTGRDRRGELMIRNELMGLYRKLARRDEAMEQAELALELVRELSLSQSATAGTVWLNAATVYKAFGQAARAVPLYEQAEEVYNRLLSPTDPRRAGLYNNYALALADLREFDRADAAYQQALDILRHTPGSEPEQAITCLNLADAAVARLGAEQADETVRRYVQRAMELLDTPGLPQDGNYAFVCEKCAPVMGYYGYFANERELSDRARRIYDRT